MNPQSNLAIVIPAYKETYFEECLESISKQTLKKFTLYIGDDNSPENLLSIVDKYRPTINITYKKFEQNLGGKDLVSHWKRCIDMVQDEEWIWLFSDDDLMDPNCVDLFYRQLNSGVDADVFHFNIDKIGSKGELIERSNDFPAMLDVKNFYRDRMRYKIGSVVVEYIFSREIYLKKGGFQNFDLAWCADDATWIKFGLAKGIHTIYGGKVKWRISGANISSVTADIDIVKRKVIAALNYIEWVNTVFTANHLKDDLTINQKVRWVLGSVEDASSFNLKQRLYVANFVLNKLNEVLAVDSGLKLYIYYLVVASRFKKAIKKLI